MRIVNCLLISVLRMTLSLEEPYIRSSQSTRLTNEETQQTILLLRKDGASPCEMSEYIVEQTSDQIMTKMKIKTAKAKGKVEQKGRPYNIRKLKDPNTSRDFVLDLKNVFQEHVLSEIEDGTLMNKWERVKNSFIITCKERLGYSRKEYKTWLSEDTIKTIEKCRNIKEQL